MIIKKLFFSYILGFFVYKEYLYCPSEASTRYCVISGGYPAQDWQSLPCAGEELDLNPGLLICSQVRYHWATSPPQIEPPLFLFAMCWGGAGFEPRSTDLQSGALKNFALVYHSDYSQFSPARRRRLGNIKTMPFTSYTGKIQLGPYQLTEKIRWYQYKEIIWYNPIQVDHSGYLYCHSAVLLAMYNSANRLYKVQLYFCL